MRCRAWGRRALALLVALVMGACARNPMPAHVEPGVEQEAVEATRPTANRLLLFQWTLREGQSRFAGEGAARVSVDYRARLDLFGPQDVPYLTAVVRGDSLRLPAGVPERIVPPAGLLWSALGVVRPPGGASPTTAVKDGSTTTLGYSAPDGRWRFRLRDGALEEAEWLARDGARYTVELSGAERGAAPRRAVYRDWREFRELILEMEAQEDVEEFPPETWILEAR